MKQITSAFTFLTVLVLMCSYFVYLQPEQAKLRQQREEFEKIQQEEDLLKEELYTLERHIGRLRSGHSRAVEQVARERFGYCLPNEKVYYFDNEEK